MHRSVLYILFIIFSYSCSNPPQVEKPKNPNFEKAYQFRDEGEKDSAFYYFNKAKDDFLQEKDSLRIAVSFVNMGIIATDIGDYFGGQEFSLNAFSYFDEKNPDHFVYISSNYNNLGIASHELKQFRKAVEFYNKSLEFKPDSAWILVTKNNMANSYRKDGDLKSALAIYEEILSQDKIPEDHARILSNYAYSKWVNNPDYDASTELREALRIRKELNHILGQSTSYYHLTDYYLKSRPDSALYFAKLRYELIKNVNSLDPDDRLLALQKLIPLIDEQNSKKYFAQYRQLVDSIQTVRNNAKNQFALIRYETEKHKANNLLLQRESTIRAIWIISLSLLLVGGSFLSIIWYKKRKKRLELESQNAIQEGQLKTSKKVHDVVANGIYQIMTEIENNKNIDQEQILDKMESLYERSRDISYDVLASNENQSNFENAIHQLLVSFASEETKVFIVGNTKETWKDLSQEDCFEIKQVLQELMVNMKKHSKATQVALRFELVDNNLNIYYTDNGIGMPEGIKFKNGLRNTGNRINSINGNINFGTSISGGLNVQLMIPIKV
jgi:tetratricopeptide (TPR) repeat protein